MIWWQKGSGRGSRQGNRDVRKLLENKSVPHFFTPIHTKDRNNSTSKINWQFTTADAQIKLKRLYPNL
jgi:hypothetical protein